MRKVTTAGLVPCSSEVELHARCQIKCIHNASDATAQVLIDMWAQTTADTAYDILSKPDVSVTNQRDKEVQLPKLKKLNEFAKRTAAEDSDA